MLCIQTLCISNSADTSVNTDGTHVLRAPTNSESSFKSHLYPQCLSMVSYAVIDSWVI
jgi:hypothetical protein